MYTILAQSRTPMTEILLPLAVISLSMSIPIVAIVTEHFQKKERMRLIEKAIEHGANIDDLPLDEPARPHLPYRSGMVTLGIGAGLLMADRYAGLNFGSFTAPLGIGGVICAGVGAALLLNDWINRRRFREEAPLPRA